MKYTYTLIRPNGSKSTYHTDPGHAVLEAMGPNPNQNLKANLSSALRSGSVINHNGYTIIPNPVQPTKPRVTESIGSDNPFDGIITALPWLIVFAILVVAYGHT